MIQVILSKKENAVPQNQNVLYQGLTPFPLHFSSLQGHYRMSPITIISTSRKREVSNARGIICHLAINHLGYSTSEVGRALSINRENAGRSALRGKKALLCREI